MLGSYFVVVVVCQMETEYISYLLKSFQMSHPWASAHHGHIIFILVSAICLGLLWNWTTAPLCHAQIPLAPFVRSS